MSPARDAEDTPPSGQVASCTGLDQARAATAVSTPGGKVSVTAAPGASREMTPATWEGGWPSPHVKVPKSDAVPPRHDTRPLPFRVTDTVLTPWLLTQVPKAVSVTPTLG